MADETRSCGGIPRTGCEYERRSRPARRKRPVAQRIRDFEPAALPDEPDGGPASAARCFGASVCRACEICVLICPDLCITRDPDTQRIVVDLDFCKGCGLCAHYCPKGAIRMVVDK
jgi:Pyruvate/2-oxoacid:ferredoxin oxidoreductase delta subunit